MSSITTGNDKQYSDSRKLAARARLNREYTIAEIGWFPWVAGQLPLKAGDRILDIGCGPGWFWAAAVDKLPESLDLTLSDLSPGMVQEAVERCQPLAFGSVTGQQADATALPFEDGAFDAVIAMHMLYHVPDQSQAIAAMHRVLKPGGFLAVTTNGAGNMRKMYELTTVFGSPPYDPGGAAFSYGAAERLMQEHFGNVAMTQHPARLRVTEPEDVFLALTSYPPGEEADEAQLDAFRDAITEAFRVGSGVLETEKETGLFISRKAA
ncbi:class I SAM-dependent methyltransferase (plasmid) [Rhizobium leguminosarum bv. viciae 248]|uniref:class I SAM-dependent methyltransferase n=1 Tax=Rhizobium leguminosarum TaxID=384 RepID=UPI00035C91D7|nr:class I SAM-dependent methyltransferase [Rhizobium leguminosarum]MCA2406626.1 class I SAM-dependent methyltransferase [Rhizobium leguminosarum]NKM59445.1 methyltransferase domain-containing protein [Rhizobium leguminosarum bv. viciae]QHW27997.1 class I SAM-dependent methyltransferase [Rhizobium leguminosarum bv. viciae 248]